MNVLASNTNALNRPWLRKTSILYGKNLDQIFCLGNIIGQSPWIRNQAKFGPQTQGGPRGPLGAQNPQCPFFEENIFFSFGIQLGIKKITQMNLKNQKNWAFFDPSCPKTNQNGSGYQWSAAGPILSFCIFSGPHFTLLGCRLTSTGTKAVFGFFRGVSSHVV